MAVVIFPVSGDEPTMTDWDKLLLTSCTFRPMIICACNIAWELACWPIRVSWGEIYRPIYMTTAKEMEMLHRVVTIHISREHKPLYYMVNAVSVTLWRLCVLMGFQSALPL